MGFCPKCGEIVRTPNGVCGACAVSGENSATSGMSSKDNRGDTYSNAYLSSGLNAGIERGIARMLGKEDKPVNENCIECGKKLQTIDDVFVGPSHAGGHVYCERCYAGNFKKGDCAECRKPVLGLGKEYVMQDGKVWHK
ncbi:hypothetical protein HK102_007752, partial [Quaeritorhiza haematococci]